MEQGGAAMFRRRRMPRPAWLHQDSTEQRRGLMESVKARLFDLMSLS